ncbi:DUF2889 domain-containing protein [Alkalilimnicola sp. S0819]|uniref:DUF2889 domain-containing protein n=1 Tax=Alkalilimnicola sp. S0819 TaxID=2613922 RepID=UPI001262378E|nr:DUF2889 domain-containing protein [Alkalilimnicola sp. S0819]KAB7622759.1 DUF2889 domain-containing protein [Alkalilimnicola sp. S0819]MPQ17252.1 DUF2889 domain-containing protein [Alkalilimnicola sp. S0819]
MPLSEPVARKPIHARRISLDAWQREDGLWDVEGHLRDTKHYAFSNRFRGEIRPGEPIHDMSLRLTLDEDMLIHAAEGVIEYHPFPSCHQAGPRYEALAGLRIGPGWMSQVRARLSAASGCTHLFELLPPMATAAFQAIAPLRKSWTKAGDKRPALINSCHGWREDGEAVKAIHPAWFRGRD